MSSDVPRCESCGIVTPCLLPTPQLPPVQPGDDWTAFLVCGNCWPGVWSADARWVGNG